MCQSYKNSQLFFVVGTVDNTDMPTNKLFIWNDELNLIISELAFFGPIIDLKVVD